MLQEFAQYNSKCMEYHKLKVRVYVLYTSGLRLYGWSFLLFVKHRTLDGCSSLSFLISSLANLEFRTIACLGLLVPATQFGDSKS